MSLYLMPKTWNRSRLQKLRKVRVWSAFALVSLFLVAVYAGIHSSGRAVALYRMLEIASLVLLINLWNPFRSNSTDKEIAKDFRIESIEIDPDGLKFNWNTWSKLVPWSEVRRFEEPPNGRGTYIRTFRWYSWYVIPRTADHYEEIKAELAATYIPFVQTSALSNYGLVFVFLFCASLLCNLLTQDRTLLLANLALALVIGFVGAILANSWITDTRFKRRSMIGSFLPAIVSALSLIFPFGLR